MPPGEIVRKEAVRLVAIGVGTATAGPLGAALGGFLGGLFSHEASKLLGEYLQSSGDALTELGVHHLYDQLCERKEHPPLEAVAQEALRLALAEVQSEEDGDLPEPYAEWFVNWDRRLRSTERFDSLSQIVSGSVTAADSMFKHVLERLDGEARALRAQASSGGVSITARGSFRAMPDDLLDLLTSRLPGPLHRSFDSLVANPQHRAAWVAVQQSFQADVLTRTGRIEVKTDRILELLAEARDSEGITATSPDDKPILADEVAQYQIDAEKGDREAQFQLAVCYSIGAHVPKDLGESAEWYRRAAELGHAEAQFRLGLCSYSGKGIKANSEYAAEWYRKAAEQGHAEAQFWLGLCYESPIGLKKDYVQAAAWYRKAAEQGYADAQKKLGFCFDSGRGVEKNLAEAVRWYKLAAVQGNQDAQYALGCCYWSGNGVFEDWNKAAEWFRRAASQGNPDARKALEEMGAAPSSASEHATPTASQSGNRDQTGATDYSVGNQVDALGLGPNRAEVELKKIAVSVATLKRPPRKMIDIIVNKRLAPRIRELRRQYQQGAPTEAGRTEACIAGEVANLLETAVTNFQWHVGERPSEDVVVVFRDTIQKMFGGGLPSVKSSKIVEPATALVVPAPLSNEDMMNALRKWKLRPGSCKGVDIAGYFEVDFCSPSESSCARVLGIPSGDLVNVHLDTPKTAHPSGDHEYISANAVGPQAELFETLAARRDRSTIFIHLRGFGAYTWKLDQPEPETGRMQHFRNQKPAVLVVSANVAHSTGATETVN